MVLTNSQKYFRVNDHIDHIVLVTFCVCFYRTISTKQLVASGSMITSLYNHLAFGDYLLDIETVRFSTNQSGRTINVIL
jgi:hypothetical protein